MADDGRAGLRGGRGRLPTPAGRAAQGRPPSRCGEEIGVGVAADAAATGGAEGDEVEEVRRPFAAGGAGEEFAEGGADHGLGDLGAGAGVGGDGGKQGGSVGGVGEGGAGGEAALGFGGDVVFERTYSWHSGVVARVGARVSIDDGKASSAGPRHGGGAVGHEAGVAGLEVAGGIAPAEVGVVPGERCAGEGVDGVPVERFHPREPAVREGHLRQKRGGRMASFLRRGRGNSSTGGASACCLPMESETNPASAG